MPTPRHRNVPKNGQAGPANGIRTCIVVAPKRTREDPAGAARSPGAPRQRCTSTDSQRQRQRRPTQRLEQPSRYGRAMPSESDPASTCPRPLAAVARIGIGKVSQLTVELGLFVRYRQHHATARSAPPPDRRRGRVVRGKVTAKTMSSAIARAPAAVSLPDQIAAWMRRDQEPTASSANLLVDGGDDDNRQPAGATRSPVASRRTADPAPQPVSVQQNHGKIIAPAPKPNRSNLSQGRVGVWVHKPGSGRERLPG